MKIYKKVNEVFFDICGELEEVAKLQGYEILEASSFFYKIGEVVYKNNKQLSNVEIKEELDKWKRIEEEICSGNFDRNKILNEITQYQFVVPLQYRGGEKECAAFVNVNEDPVDKVCSWEEYPEFWEIIFDDIIIEEFYYLLREIYNEII